MTSGQRRVLAMLTLAVLAGLALILTAGCTDEAVIPQQVVSPSWKDNEVRPLFTSCAHARQAGVPLPITVGDPGFNPRLDHDSNGVIC